MSKESRSNDGNIYIQVLHWVTIHSCRMLFVVCNFLTLKLSGSEILVAIKLLNPKFFEIILGTNIAIVTLTCSYFREHIRE